MTFQSKKKVSTQRLFHPLSLKALAPLGLGLAVLPLLLGIVSAMVAVEKLAVLSQQTVYQVSRQVQNSQMLLERLSTLERKSKQFLVLDDEDSLQAYRESREQFQQELSKLLELAVPAALADTVRQLREEEEGVYQRLVAEETERTGKRRGRESDRRDRVQKATFLFQGLYVKGQSIAGGVSAYVETEVSDLALRSNAVWQGLLTQAIVISMVSLLMIIFFMRWIIAPIQQLDHAIRGLGAGAFNAPIKVKGARDLEFLGERLEWLRTRLNDLEEAKQRFMRNVSHEIKTPLSTLREGTELLGDEVVGQLNPEQIEISRILIKNTQRLHELFERLLDYSQANAQTSERAQEQLDMQGLVDSLIQEYQIQLRAKSLKVVTALEPMEIFGNRDQMRTVIDNLLSNAVKYSPCEGEIQITLRATGGHMVLEVEDDGPGIDPAERARVFEPFFQGRASREAGVGGTGLGLAIVRECVVSHHGKVEALEPKRSGARIRVQLPIDPEPR